MTETSSPLQLRWVCTSHRRRRAGGILWFLSMFRARDRAASVFSDDVWWRKFGTFSMKGRTTQDQTRSVADPVAERHKSTFYRAQNKVSW